jgi:hypothetical protein
MRHITSSRLKQSSFLLDRLHKLKAWSRRKFLVEEQGKPICVPNERGRQHQHAQSCFLSMASALPGLLFGSDLLRLLPCFLEPHALPIIPGNEQSFPVQRGPQKSDGHSYQAGECQFFAQTWTRRSHCSAVSGSRPSAISAQADVFSTTEERGEAPVSRARRSRECQRGSGPGPLPGQCAPLGGTFFRRRSQR